MAERPAPREAGGAQDRRALLDGLARKFERPLARWFRRRSPNAADVPDLVQEVFLGLSRMKDPTRIERPETFLFVVAANVLRDRHRREATRYATAHQAFDDTLVEGSEIPIDRVLTARERIAQIRASLDELPVRTRDVFVLKAFEERSIRDIASAFAISTRAAEKHYAKALAHVARALMETDHRQPG